MSNEDNVVDLGDVTVPESKPQTEPQTAGPAPDEPSLEDEGNPWKRPSDSADMDQNEVEQARAAKKPRTEIMRDTSSKNRGLRMMGVLKGTLSKFKDEGSKSGRTDAAKRRQEVEERLRAKLKAEQEVSERKNERVKTERNLRNELLHRQDEKALLEQVYKKRQSGALHLANFLCTSLPTSESTSEQNGLATRPSILASRLPLHAHPAVQPTAPIYFKPYKLLPDQSARIEDQLADARKAVEEDREAWKTESAQLEDKIAEAARNKERFEEERERQDRQERLQERRENGMDEDDDQEMAHRGRDSPSREPNDDVNMD